MFKLLSHAMAPSPHNTTTTVFYGGKPATVVVGECNGLIERQGDTVVHLRADADSPRCIVCMQMTGPAHPWYDSPDRWEVHPMRCE